jgi:hypothetical protein
MAETHNQINETIAEKESRPDCYGDPQTVCPVDENGVMQPQTACLACGFLKSCLQKALRKQGLIPPSLREAPAVVKMSNFLKRWSDQKLSRSDPST